MRLKNIYDLAVKKGIERDPRTKAQIKESLDSARKEYRKLKGADKKAFDTERLKNPYADTRILYGDLDKEIRTVLVGIDMEGPELLLADRLNQAGDYSIDLVMAHHPEGTAWARLYDVMGLQANVLEKFGIPLKIGEGLLKERSEEVSRSLAPANHSRSVDIARLLGLPFMCIHTPADNHVADHLQRLFDRTKPKKLAQVTALLKRIPEYADGSKKGAGPRILVGSPDKEAGRIFVDMTGGTEGPKRVYARLSQAGVGTIVAMHLSEEHLKCVKEEHINIVIAGHIASDTLGLNLLLDSLEKSGKLNVIPCSGFVRVKR
ncbi:MAG: NGG1p interacting factor NIF3 [Candidatus Omnitrophica bacterium]|nr:NGG1p interacting factor NIF3 [Candidatus Omnitrophota bacterium]MDD5437014.1 NGG1p interacting factor NIF3 [Candidatus Omnitrophota bacterium]